MAANLTTHLPITVAQTSTNTTERTDSYLELAGQTFPSGSVVNLTSAGYVQLWPGGSPGSNRILGVPEQPGANLGSSGAGAAPAFGSIGAPGSPSTYGSVPNQPSAVNIPSGATFSTGQTVVALAVPTTIFRGQVDNSTGAVAADYTATIANIGKTYGVTQSSSDQTFYVDLTAAGGSTACVTIVDLDPDTMAVGSSTSGTVNGNVYFTFLLAASQIQQ
jgi:hypothetical protein